MFQQIANKVDFSTSDLLLEIIRNYYFDGFHVFTSLSYVQLLNYHTNILVEICQSVTI